VAVVVVVAVVIVAVVAAVIAGVTAVMIGKSTGPKVENLHSNETGPQLCGPVFSLEETLHRTEFLCTGGALFHSSECTKGCIHNTIWVIRFV
jgi:hypothetical protein